MKSVKVDSTAYRPGAVLPVALTLLGVVVWGAMVLALMAGAVNGGAVLALIGASIAVGLLWLALGALVSAARDTRYLTAIMAEQLLATPTQKADPPKRVVDVLNQGDTAEK